MVSLHFFSVHYLILGVIRTTESVTRLVERRETMGEGLVVNALLSLHAISSPAKPNNQSKSVSLRRCISLELCQNLAWEPISDDT